MNRSAAVGLVLVLAATAVLIAGSAAFSSAEVERSIEVDVVGDPDAYLGLVYTDAVGGDHETAEDLSVDVTAGEATTIVDAHNQFHAPMDAFGVAVADDGGFDLVEVTADPTADIGVGESSQVDLLVDGEVSRSGTVVLDLSGAGAGFSVDAVRELEVHLAVPGVPEPTVCDPDAATHTVPDGESLQINNADFEEAVVVIGGSDVHIKLNNIDVAGSVCIEAADDATLELINTETASPNEIAGDVTVAAGDRAAIEVTNNDIEHDLLVVALEDGTVKVTNNDIGGELTIDVGDSTEVEENNNRVG